MTRLAARTTRGTRDAAVAPRPAVERLWVAQDGEVVHGDDERHGGEKAGRGTSGSGARRARSRSPGAAARRVPPRVADDGRDAAGAARAPSRTSSTSSSRVEALDVARRARAGLVERRDVEPDANQRRLQVPLEEDPARLRPREASRRARARARRARRAGRARSRSPPRSPPGSRDRRARPRRRRPRPSTGATSATTGAPQAIASIDRHPEALEARRVDERRRAAVEARELVVGHVAEPDDARPVERRLLAPALAAGDREREAVAASSAMRLDERAEVLARLERRDREHVAAAEVGASRRRLVKTASTPGLRDAHAAPRASRAARDVARGERRVREDDVAACAPRSGTSRPCIERVRPCTHSGWRAARGRGSSSRGSRRAAADTSSPRSGARRTGRGSARRAGLPRRLQPWPPEVREGEELERELDRDALERLGDRLPPLRARRREGDDLVLAGGRLREPRERAAEVVADPRARVRERRDVEGDPHGSVVEADEVGAELARVVALTGYGRLLDLEAHDALSSVRLERDTQLLRQGREHAAYEQRRGRRRARSRCSARENSAGSLCSSTVERAAAAVVPRVRDARPDHVSCGYRPSTNASWRSGPSTR